MNAVVSGIEKSPIPPPNRLLTPLLYGAIAGVMMKTGSKQKSVMLTT